MRFKLDCNKDERELLRKIEAAVVYDDEPGGPSVPELSPTEVYTALEMLVRIWRGCK